MKKLYQALLPLGTAVLGMLWMGSVSASAEEPAIATDTTTVLTDVVGTPDTWVQESDGSWRYYDDNGSKCVGTQAIDGQIYVFAQDGTLRTGWQTVNGCRRYYDPETGQASNGWVHYQGQYYYVMPDAGKCTGIQFGLPSLSGAETDENTQFFLDAYGALQLGHFSDADGYYYYADASGVIATGAMQLEGVWYSFQADGKQSTGWVEIQGNSYYFDEDTGESQLGLVQLSDGTYYITAEDGKQTGAQTIDGKSYYFDTATGAMHTGWLTTAEGVYYYNSTTGVQQPSGLCTISGSLFYFQENGTLLQSGSVAVDGKTYLADATGVLTEETIVTPAAPTPAPEKDASGNTYVMGESKATVAQMQAYIRSVNPSVAQSVLDMIPYYLSEGEAEGVRGDIAFAQACLETGNFTFKGSAVTLSQNNFCGLGVTRNGVKGCSFATPQLGIRAQIQHLKAYASTADLQQAQVDSRFGYVTRGCAPVVEWLGIPDNPKHLGWAARKGYGASILSILAAILKR